jgi:hypothetical protein
MGTVGDGVKSNILTALRVISMTTQFRFDGVTRKGVKSKMHDGLENANT